MKIGDVGESKALYEFLRLGIPVSLPFGNNCQYDMIIDCCGTLYKVQVKTISSPKDEKFYFELSKSVYRRGMGLSNGRKEYSLEDVDLFFLFCVATGDFCLVENKELLGAKSICFRSKGNLPLNCQKSGVRYIEDYTLEKTFQKMGYTITDDGK